MKQDIGYLQHGAGTSGPFRTELVSVKMEQPFNWYAQYEGKWRRVHITLRRTYILCNYERITIQIDGV